MPANPHRMSRFGAQAGQIRGGPGANKYRPNPARPLVTYFIMNIVAGLLLAWAVIEWGGAAQSQLSPVEVVIKAAPDTQTADIRAAIEGLDRKDVDVQSADAWLAKVPASTGLLIVEGIIFCFVVSAPFFFIFSIAYFIVAKFNSR